MQEYITATATSACLHCSPSRFPSQFPSHHRAMDKGKSTAATTSQGTGVSGKEQGEIKSGGDGERASTSAAGGGGGGAGAGASSSSSAPSAAVTRATIPPFVDGEYVRLRNRCRGGYLFADEEGRRVCVDRRRGMVQTAWAVQILRHGDGTARVLLRSAYGRYLSSTGYAARFGLVGRKTVQCISEDPGDHEIEWSVATGTKRGSVALFQVVPESGGMRAALRANGRYQRWNTEVTFGRVDLNNISSMMEWEVQVIPLTLEAPPYQARPPNAAIRLPKGCEKVIDIAYCRAWFGDNGSIEHEIWIQLRFRGRSLTRLRMEIAKLLGVQVENMILFAQAGFIAKPIPLLTDLHLRDDPRMILAFTVDSPGYNALRFPDLAAE